MYDITFGKKCRLIQNNQPKNHVSFHASYFLIKMDTLFD
jgi:hypothetical protein